MNEIISKLLLTLVFSNITSLMEVLKIFWLEEQSLIKYCVIRYLILLKIRNMMVVKRVLFQWFINFLIKRPLLVVLKMRVFKTKN